MKKECRHFVKHWPAKQIICCANIKRVLLCIFRALLTFVILTFGVTYMV